MTYSVSSAFVDYCAAENPPVKRTFTIAGSDYSDWVLRWPTVRTRWNELQPNNVTISLANEDQTFNFFKEAKANVQAECQVKFGFTDSSLYRSSWAQVSLALPLSMGTPALAALNGSDVAFVDFNAAPQIKTFRLTDGIWAQVGSSLSVASAFTYSGLALLNETDMAQSDTGSDLLKTYRWDGFGWAQVGSGLAVPAFSQPPAITAITSAAIAFIDGTNLTLRTYEWSGSLWSQVGSGLLVSPFEIAALTALDSSNVAFSDNISGAIKTYQWSGSLWSQVGSQLIVATSGASPVLSALNATDVAYANNQSDELRAYRWSGSLWSQVGSGLYLGSIANDMAVAALNNTDVAFVDASSDTLRTYRFTETNDELLTAFSGTVADLAFKDGSVDLRIVDKVQRLSDRIVGTSKSATVFSSNTLLPSDIAWTLCTCYGGLSTVQSTSNPDIDYAAFRTWANAFSLDQIYMGASFKGQKVTEALRKLTENTQSAAFVANDKLTFARWTATDSGVLQLTDNHIKSLGVKIKADALINKQWVEFNYNVTSRNWSNAVYEANTASINSYGTRETVMKDESVWYTTSASALNLAQRFLLINQLPYNQVDLTTPLVALYKQVGDTVNVTDSHLDLGDSWRIMEMALNTDDGSMELVIDNSQGVLSSLTWTERANPKNYRLYGIAWSGGLFAAVGAADGTDSYLITSPDGATWTERAPTVAKNFDLYGIAWGNSLFVAVGASDGTNSYILTSPDGITWTERNPTVSKAIALRAVVWASSLALFVAVGDADGTDSYILTSPDGTTWTERAPTVAKNFGLNAVAWSDSLLAAVGDADGTDAYIVTSTDGITWTERANPKNFALNGVVWRVTKWIAVGAADGTDAYAVTSDDGITWAEQANGKNFDLNAIAWNGSLAQAVGAADGTDAYMPSTEDGITYIERSNPKNYALRGIAWSGNVFCAVGDAAPTAMTWTERTNPSNTALNDAAGSGSLLVAVGNTSGGDAYAITSTDGVAWVERSTPRNLALYGVTWSSPLALFCAVGERGAPGLVNGTYYITTSLNGITWTNRSQLASNFNADSGALYDVVWNGSLFCTVGGSINSGVQIANAMTSTNGISWTERLLIVKPNLYAVTWGVSVGLFVAVGGADGTDAYIITSPDGTTWTERANPKNFALNDIAWNSTASLFVAVGAADGTDAYVVTSADGVTWAERANPKNFALNSVIWSGKQFIAMGAADGADAYIITSIDGTTWTEVANPKNFALKGITWDGTRYVAVGAADGTDAYIITSTDDPDAYIITSF
jgi:hypothetical protein